MALRELDHRTADNGRVEISLDWDDTTEEVILTISDEDGTRQINVAQGDASYALAHPYAYEEPIRR